LPAKSPINNLLSLVFIDTVLGNHQQDDRILIFNGAFVDSTGTLEAISTSDTNPLYCCLLPVGKSGKKKNSSGPLPPPQPSAPNAVDEKIVHFAPFLVDQSTSKNFALSPGSKVDKLLAECGDQPAVVFFEGKVVPPTSELAAHKTTEENPMYVCMLGSKPAAAPAPPPVPIPPPLPDPEDAPDPNLVELTFKFSDSDAFDIRSLNKTLTVQDLFPILQPLAGVQGKEPRTIALFRFKGEDLAPDRVLETIAGTSIHDGFHPIDVVYVGDEEKPQPDPATATATTATTTGTVTAAPPPPPPAPLTPDQENKVTGVIEIMGKAVTREQVIAALERNGWDGDRATQDLVDHPPPPDPQTRPPPVPAPNADIAETAVLLGDLSRAYQTLSPEEQEGIVRLVRGGDGIGGVDLLTAVSQFQLSKAAA
jgi:hypothetical protein